MARTFKNSRGDVAILISLGVSLTMMACIVVLQLSYANQLHMNTNYMNALDSFLSNEVYAWHGYLKNQAETSGGKVITAVPKVSLLGRSTGVAAGAAFCGESKSGEKICVGPKVNLSGGIEGSWQTGNSVGVPEQRYGETSVWTGKQLIVWGGSSVTRTLSGVYSYNGDVLSTGGIYDPANRTWRTMDAAKAPIKFVPNSATWIGDRVIFLGYQYVGQVPQQRLECSSFAYDPEGDTWTHLRSVDTSQNPWFCFGTHSAVWTGTKLLVLGPGRTGGGSHALWFFDPKANIWSESKSNAFPSPAAMANLANERVTAVWTGTKMIVWGGVNYGGSFSKRGAVYDPATDVWTATSLVNAPEARDYHAAIWTGKKMVIWGGWSRPDMSTVLNTGAQYDPVTDTWMPTSLEKAPIGRVQFAAVWSGTKMIIVGGGSGGPTLDSGGLYDPVRDAWSITPSAGAPKYVWGGKGNWTGKNMVIWGGDGSGPNVGTDVYLYSPTNK